MKIARFWVRESAKLLDSDGVEVSTTAWGWSSDNAEEARGRAKAAAERVVRYLARLIEPENSWFAEYQYFGGRPPREEILQEFHDASGETFATITRNIYGSMVLNCRDLMFIDVDCREPSALLRLVRAMFRMSGPTRHSEAAALENIRLWSKVYPQAALNVYRTAAGLRVAIVDRAIRANDPDVHGILKEMDSDPRYRLLCNAQQCFRARLSPKPWRMGVEMLRERYPYENATAEATYRDWLSRYDAAASRYATCQFVERLGPQAIDSTLAPLIELHDAMTGIANPLPLA